MAHRCGTSGSAIRPLLTLAILFAVLPQEGAAAASSPPDSLQRKMRQLQEAGERWQRVQRLMGDFEPLMQAGNFPQAEALADRALAALTEGSQDGRPDAPHRTTPIPVKLGTIPETAEIVYHSGKGLVLGDGRSHIYVMDRAGKQTTQITFESSRNWEHVAVSHDRRFIIANEQLPNPAKLAGGVSRLWLYDLAKGTEAQLVPGFMTAGNGGVDWDREGFIYFAGKAADVVSDPQAIEDFIANAGANDVYRIKADGIGLQRLTNTPQHGESDVSVSEDGTMVAHSTLAIADPAHAVCELWVLNSDGTNHRLVYRGGPLPTGLVADPELSPDNARLVFSKVNLEVPPNFPEHAAANTAHDLWTVRLDGTGLMRLTKPGPISILPDWVGDLVVYMELNDAEDYLGVSLVAASQPDQPPRRIIRGAQGAKWIPPM